MLFDILALISVLIVILLLGRMVNIFPSLMACTLRWKESVNLEASVKHSLDRDLFAVAMILPFCLTVERFGLYAPRFMDSFGAGLHLTAIIGIFLIYILIRTLVSKMIRPHKMQPKTYRTGVRSSFITKYDLRSSLDSAGTYYVQGKEISRVEVPKMNEEILVEDGKVFINFESGANEWWYAAMNTDRILAVKEKIWGKSK